MYYHNLTSTTTVTFHNYCDIPQLLWHSTTIVTFYNYCDILQLLWLLKLGNFACSLLMLTPQCAMSCIYLVANFAFITTTPGCDTEGRLTSGICCRGPPLMLPGGRGIERRLWGWVFGMVGILAWCVGPPRYPPRLWVVCDEWMFVVHVGMYGWRGVGVEDVGWWMCVWGEGMNSDVVVSLWSFQYSTVSAECTMW